LEFGENADDQISAEATIDKIMGWNTPTEKIK
jgi:hypothetical protein